MYQSKCIGLFFKELISKEKFSDFPWAVLQMGPLSYPFVSLFQFFSLTSNPTYTIQTVSPHCLEWRGCQMSRCCPSIPTEWCWSDPMVGSRDHLVFWQFYWPMYVHLYSRHWGLTHSLYSMMCGPYKQFLSHGISYSLTTTVYTRV